MSEIFEVTIRSGETLRGWHWPAKAPVTNLTIITGMNEYAKRYEPFAEWMNEQHVNIWKICRRDGRRAVLTRR